jgi:hypothetical protein
MRVQIPAYTDRWIMGDRYGEIVKIVKGRKSTRKTLGEAACRREEVAHVKLDQSGRTVRVILDDCEIL